MVESGINQTQPTTSTCSVLVKATVHNGLVRDNDSRLLCQQDVWDAVIRQTLPCKIESENASNP